MSLPAFTMRWLSEGNGGIIPVMVSDFHYTFGFMSVKIELFFWLDLLLARLEQQNADRTDDQQNRRH